MVPSQDHDRRAGVHWDSGDGGHHARFAVDAVPGGHQRGIRPAQRHRTAHDHHARRLHRAADGAARRSGPGGYARAVPTRAPTSATAARGAVGHLRRREEGRISAWPRCVAAESGGREFVEATDERVLRRPVGHGQGFRNAVRAVHRHTDSASRWRSYATAWCWPPRASPSRSTANRCSCRATTPAKRPRPSHACYAREADAALRREREHRDGRCGGTQFVVGRIRSESADVALDLPEPPPKVVLEQAPACPRRRAR